MPPGCHDSTRFESLNYSKAGPDSSAGNRQLGCMSHKCNVWMVSTGWLQRGLSYPAARGPGQGPSLPARHQSRSDALSGRQRENSRLFRNNYVRPGRVPGGAPGIDAAAGIALVGAALVIGLATAGDYGLTVDEFNADDYGPKALAWYTSGGSDRSHLESVEHGLWYYGPWHQILTAIVQSFGLTDRLTVRHAMTFLAGLAGVAALIPIARLSVGRLAGPVAIVLCLMTGYFYGSLFFTPIDVPFMAAMTWATCAILLMARREVPSWPATIVAGLLIGLATSTRTGGIITQAYLAAAMALCALELAIRKQRAAARPLAQIGLRTLAAMALAWITMIAVWPWLQIGNPLRQFAMAHRHFIGNPMSFGFPHWGEQVRTDALPWHYIPGQLLARLPEGFLLLLALALLFAIAAAVCFARATIRRLRRRGVGGLTAPALVLARSRGTLLVMAAALVPIGFVMVTRATHYDGVRHVLFVIPMLAVLAGGVLPRLMPLLRRRPHIAFAAIVVAAAHIGATAVMLARLHPLEYVAMNSLAGGTKGAAERFELDYWAAAATEALRRLEQRLDSNARFATRLPRVLVCISNWDWAAGLLFRREWLVEQDRDNADFIIETERWLCAKDSHAMLIDEVKRFDVAFARIYANNRGRAWLHSERLAQPPTAGPETE